MSQNIFNQRIARITNHTGGGSEMARGEGGTATAIYSSPAVGKDAPTVRRNVKPLLLGAVLGMIAGSAST